jgi:hypothetical protein
MINPKHILAGIAIILAIVGMIWPNNVIFGAAIVLLGVAMFVP